MSAVKQAANAYARTRNFVQLGPALMTIEGWAVLAVGEVLERATNVARQLEGSRELALMI